MLDHVAVKSERCQSVLSEAMDYSGDKNDLTGLTQNVFSRETCPGEFDDFSDILASEWGNLENVKEAELYANERCANCDENPVVEENTGKLKYFVEMEKRRYLRIPTNLRMSTSLGNR